MRARTASLTALFAAIAAVVACSSSSAPSHPGNIVDCQPPPISSVTGPSCPGICLQSEHCDGGGPVCPPGFRTLGIVGCANQALCCYLDSDGGAEGGVGDGGAEGGVGDGGAEAGSDAGSGDADAAADATGD